MYFICTKQVESTSQNKVSAQISLKFALDFLIMFWYPLNYIFSMPINLINSIILSRLK